MKNLIFISSIILSISSITYADNAFRMGYSEWCIWDDACLEDTSIEKNADNVSANGTIKTEENGATTFTFQVVSTKRDSERDIIIELHPPNTKSLRQATNGLIYGGLTEFLDGSYVVARHVWMNSSLDEVKMAFPEVDQYNILEVVDNSNLPKDILVITKMSADEFKDRFSNYFEAPDSLSKWVSWQFGNDEKKSSKKPSWGVIQEVFDQNDFYLSSNPENLTAPASSGSVVWSYNDSREKAPLGIITCVKNNTDSRYVQNRLAYVTSFSRVFNQDLNIKKIDLQDSLKNVLIEQVPNCLPVDGRAAGGD